MNELATQLGQLLLKRKWLISTAESCTGGGIASAITDVAGASNWFEMGFVTYSDQAKHALLGVSKDSLQRHGAVSEAVVREMALGAQQKAGAHMAVAVSGIAGPSGASKGKPLGMVCIAIAHPGHCATSTIYLQGDRASVRQQTVSHALQMLISTIENA